MANYKDIEKANAAIKATDIKGKDYVEVNQRVKAFRMVYPEGFIKTDIISLENGICLMKAVAGVYTYDGEQLTEMILGTGYASEKEGSSFINKTSYIENCETSAVGRALGMAGFGIDAQIASSEEQQNAELNQGKKASPKQVEMILEICKKLYPHEELDEEALKEWPMEKAEQFIKKHKEAE